MQKNSERRRRATFHFSPGHRGKEFAICCTQIFLGWRPSMSKRILLITCAALITFFLVSSKETSLHASDNSSPVSPADSSIDATANRMRKAEAHSALTLLVTKPSGETRFTFIRPSPARNSAVLVQV